MDRVIHAASVVTGSLLAVVAVSLALLAAIYCVSLVVRPKHLRTVWDMGPPKMWKVRLKSFEAKIEANTEADSQRDEQARALLEQVQELQRRQDRTDAAIAYIMANLTHAGGTGDAHFG